MTTTTVAATDSPLSITIRTTNVLIEAAIAPPAGKRTCPTPVVATWTGEAFNRLFSDVCRDIATLATKTVTGGCIPPAVECNVMADIPNRLTMALSRLMDEAMPALHNAIENKPMALQLIEWIQTRANEEAVLSLYDAHDLMQSRWEHITEIEQWSGQDGTLIRCCTAVAETMDRIALTTAKFAPASNPQSLHTLRDTAMHLKGLKATLQRLRA